MGSFFSQLAVDAHDVNKVARFWCEVLGYDVLYDEDGYIEIGKEGRMPTLFFAPVPENKTVKNRLHIDLSPVDRDQDAELERILGLGATRVDVGQGDDVTWVVLADPEGNEFCLLRTQLPDAAST
ncbi:MAG TPA: VOC family protein [Actinomycetota bacterium]|nr:VOC family protein [Actinomycetota bacterium]